MNSVNEYDVIWQSPSSNADGSMPLGNGDIGLNAWITPDGDLNFYIGKTDSWGDNSRLLKLGRLRFSFAPALPMEDFEQRLNLAEGTLVVHYGDSATLKLWVDAHRPIIQMELESKRPVTVTSTIELWRNEAAVLPELEVSDVLLDRSVPEGQREPTVIEPDTLIDGEEHFIGWYHHNRKSVGPALTRRFQGMEGYDRKDPILHRIFGALVFADSAKVLTNRKMCSGEACRHRYSIPVLTRQPSTPESWLAAAKAIAAQADETGWELRYAEHQSWWKGFWNRSYIHVRGDDDAMLASQSYALQRYMNACAGRGAFPIKFNGSIFTVPYPDKPGDADYRRWGPGYWWQNTRLPYLSMLTAGDCDLMAPFFAMYVDTVLPACRYRTRHYFGHGGAYMPECVYFWGDVFSDTYGWTPFEEREDKLQASSWHKREWVSGLELVVMLLDYYEHTQDEAFLANAVLPTAADILTFFDQYYDVDSGGKLHMAPAQALETWWECVNPMPELAGLHYVTERLLELPHTLTEAQDRAGWQAMRDKLPPVPTRLIDGKPALAPAQEYDVLKNWEAPELYAIFPFRLFAFNRPDLELARTACMHRDHKAFFGWQQDDIFLACLGCAEEARAGLVERIHGGLENVERTDLLAIPNPSRFPAFWGPNYDWIPDQDHGAVLMKTLQTMLLQCSGDTLHLFPAWPIDWNVSFKLHAPGQTILEGVLEEGQLKELKVTPEFRRKDVKMNKAFKGSLTNLNQ
jgi:hypothetical protein